MFHPKGNRNKVTGEEAPQPVLPADVRFAIQYRKSLLGSGDIAKLFRNGLQSLGFYMAMRATSDSDSVQSDLLERAATRKFDLSRLTVADATTALQHLETQNPPNVEGAKLHAVNLTGVENWTSRFSGVLAPLVEERPDAELFMLANAPYIGLEELAAVSLRRGRALGILKPGRLGQTAKPVGFMLEPSAHGTDIHLLQADFERPESAIVFDDASFTGKSRDMVMDFWGDSNLPHFVTAVTAYDGSSLTPSFATAV